MRLCSFSNRDITYEVSLASEQTLDGAQTLVDERYAWRGLHAEKAGVGLSRQVIVLRRGASKEIAGTIAVVDGSQQVLPAETLFGSEVQELRAGERLTEFSRLATAPDLRAGVAIFSLFQTALVVSQHLYEATLVLCEVNPRHVNFYARSLGFDGTGPERFDEQVGAPGVLLGQSAAQVRSWIDDPDQSDIPRFYGNRLTADARAELLENLSGIKTLVTV
jgi:hypothetical protein